MPEARLEFGGKAKMELDGVATTAAMGLRDFLSIWRMDDDPRFDDIDATLSTRASIHLAMGGPEDACGGGLVDVRAGVHATAIKLYGEQFDDGDADLEFRQFDRAAAMQGTDVVVRALTLHKYHPQGKEPSGSILGSGRISKGGALHASVVMEAIPLFRVQSLGALRAQTEGSVSGIANFDGTLDDFTIELRPRRDAASRPRHAARPVAPARARDPDEPPGEGRRARRAAAAPIAPPFDKEAYLADTSSHGDVVVDGDIGGGAVHLDSFHVTRAPKPRHHGQRRLQGARPRARSGASRRPRTTTTRPTSWPSPREPRRTSSRAACPGALALERVQVGSLEHAKVAFRAVGASRFARGIERVVLRPTTGDDRARRGQARRAAARLRSPGGPRAQGGGHAARRGDARDARPGARAGAWTCRRSTSGSSWASCRSWSERRGRCRDP